MGATCVNCCRKLREREKEHLGEGSTKESHHSSGDSPRDRNGDEPSDDDISKQRPIDALFRANATDRNDTAHFAMRRADRNRQIRRDQHGEGRGNFNDKTTERERSNGKRGKTPARYLDGVIFVRSSPIVRMTRRPQTHRPMEMPNPPKNKTHSGVLAVAATLPVV